MEEIIADEISVNMPMKIQNISYFQYNNIKIGSSSYFHVVSTNMLS